MTRAAFPGRADWIACLSILAGGALQTALYLHDNAQLITNYADIRYIAGFLRGFSENVWSGNLYPRWLGFLLAGSGAPVFVFHPPLAYLIGSLFALPASIDPFGIYQLGLAMGAGLTASSLAAYGWLRRHGSALPALCAALLLLFAPSQFVLLHERMGLTQLWATAWFPCAAYGLERWRESGNRRFLLGFSLALALILFTHMASFILFAPVLWLYGCFYRPTTARAIAALSSACLLSIGLAAIYLWPALINRAFIHAGWYLSYFSTSDTMRFFSPFILLSASPFLISALWALWMRRRNPGPEARAIVICGLITLAAGPFFLPVSKPAWDHIFLFHLLQAPFRFLSLYAVLWPPLLLYLLKRGPLLPVAWILCMIQLPAAWAAWQEYTFFREHSRGETVQQALRESFALGATATEYEPIWMPLIPMINTSAADGLKSLRALPPVAVTGGKARARIISWKDQRILLDVSAATPSTLRLRQHYFPAWQARDGVTSLPVRPDAAGLMRIDVPPGARRIDVTFSALPGERESAVLSLVSLLAWLVLFLYKPRHVFPLKTPD